MRGELLMDKFVMVEKNFHEVGARFFNIFLEK